MSRLILSSCAVAGLIAASATPAFALKNEDFQGKPAKFTPGKLNVGVWHDDDGQHVRFSTAGKKTRSYAGKVCGAKILKLDGHLLEDNDKVSIGPEGHCVHFDFTTDGAVDGFDFRVEGDVVTYDIQLDGKQLPTGMVYIGGASKHPHESPFILNRL